MAALAVIGVASCDTPSTAPSAFAYDPTGLTGGQLYRWDNGRRVNVYVIPGSAGSSQISAAVDAAIPRWNAVPRGETVTLRRTTTPAEANVVVYDNTTPLPVITPAACPFSSASALGYTYFCAQNGRAVTLPFTAGGGVATVVIRLDLARVTTRLPLEAVVMHELGHAIGIGGHSDSENDVMFAAPQTTTVSGRDTQTLRYLLAQRADVLL
ncbi:hypothetical protein [Gemmatimonas sp.]|uniref:hypothetical protein n=1 Tax=Gemmatimonas sp. TaxID=1962908 RepID=UPI00334071A3